MKKFNLYARFFFIFFILFKVQSIGKAQTFNADSAFIAENYVKKEVNITVRDGIKLFTSIYSPRDNSKTYPILLSRTPYTVAPYSASEMKKRFQNMTLARSGYIFVFQDVRGRWMSEGEFVDVRPINMDRSSTKNIDESTDTYDTVDWLVKNTNCNGKVGVYGISYPGFYATNALIKAHPAVKAVSPQAPVTDWFLGDDFHHNGALMLEDAFSFYLNFGRPRPVPTTTQTPTKLEFPDNYNFYLNVGALSDFTKKYMGDSIKFWNDLMSHPNYDAFWKARNIRNFLNDVQPASLVVGGLFDAEDCFGAWNTYKAIEKQNVATHSNRLVMGPWFHGAWGGRSEGEKLGNIHFGSATSEYYQKEIEFPFFEFYLKDKGAMNIAECNIFETGTNKWTTYNSWPPENSKDVAFFLDSNGKLSTVQPSIENVNVVEWTSDPNHPVPYTEDVINQRTREYMDDDQRFAFRRPDVASFQTEILTEDVTATGPIVADLLFSTSSTDADIIVKVIDVFPDDEPTPKDGKVTMGGYQMLVRGEVMRGKFRKNFETPAPFTPNEPTDVKFTLPDIAHTFKRGHKLMVQIQSSWFPLVDRNPQKFLDIYHSTRSNFVSAHHILYCGGNNAARIILKIKK